MSGTTSLAEKKLIAKNARADALNNYNSILDNIKNTDTFSGVSKEASGFYDPSLHASYVTNSKTLSSYLTGANQLADHAARLSTAFHEVGSHAALRGDKKMPMQMQKALKRPFFTKDDLVEISNNTSDPLRFTAATEVKRPYLTSPEEIHARILQTRLHSGKFPQGQLT